MSKTVEVQDKVVAQLREVVLALCDHKEFLRIEASHIRNTITIEVEAHEDDSPKIIGRKGKVAESLRVIFTAICAKMGKKLYLHVVSPKFKKREG